MFALIDGNNFHVSCERAFSPSLRGLPVVVLSNHDGCAIARSDDYVECCEPSTRWFSGLMLSRDAHAAKRPECGNAQ